MMTFIYCAYQVWHKGSCLIESFCPTCDTTGPPPKIILADILSAVLALMAAIEVVIR